MNALASFHDHYGVAAPHGPIVKSSFSNPISSMPEHIEGETLKDTRANNGHSQHNGEVPNTSGRVSTDELVDFVKARANKLTVKELSKLTGLSEQAVKNLRLGTAGASAQTISTWCRNDESFRLDYFRWCGGYLECEPEFVRGISMALNALVRRNGGKP